MNNQALKQYGQYKYDIFSRLNFDFQPGKKILDVGCGDCSDARIFVEYYHLDTYACDIFTHENTSQIPDLKFQKAGIYNLPYPDQTFDYLFLHDVLHHIDEPKQRQERHLAGLNELRRVCKKGGHIIIVEANRYNFLFYPHMVKTMGHDHFTQPYFKKIIRITFPQANFKHFEAHHYPWGGRLWKPYEWLMNNLVPPQFAAYNVAVI